MSRAEQHYNDTRPTRNGEVCPHCGDGIEVGENEDLFAARRKHTDVCEENPARYITVVSIR